MTKTQIFEFMAKNPGFHLATAEGDQPRVRGMLLFKADENGIVFHTGTHKEMYNQIVANPKVELCFNNLPDGVQVRVTGKLDIVEDKVVKDEILNHPSRVFLKGWIASMPSKDELYKHFKVFRLKNGKAVVWTMPTNLEPKKVIAL